MVFQDPYSTLNPRHTVRRSLSEALRAADATRTTRAARIARAARAMSGCRRTMPTRRPPRFPAASASGWRSPVRWRSSPKILVCDEPVSALDVSVQAQILNLFKRLQDERGLSYLFITHDLAVVRQVVDRLYVLYLGEIVESGPTEEVMSRPQHPYTRRLIDFDPALGRVTTPARSAPWRPPAPSA